MADGNSTAQLRRTCKIDRSGGKLHVMKWLTPFALFAACAATPPTPPVLDDTCGAADRAALVGRDATALEKVLILGMVRVIRPGDMVTQDYRPTRINFMVGADETITAVTCG